MAHALLQPFGLHAAADLPAADDVLEKRSPIDGALVGRLRKHTAQDLQTAATSTAASFSALRSLPMPARGQIVRELGEALRAHKSALAALVTLEAGKIKSEAEGEIQEMVDICEYATGLSRTIGGKTLSSERAHHNLVENWRPLGPVFCITAFNFPAAVWAWNTALAVVCGDPVLWKPSQKTPFTALACTAVAHDVLARHGLGDALQTVIVDDDVAGIVLDDPRFPLVSATGSTRMGRAVQARVHARFGKTLLELGGNNALVVMDDADVDMALRAVVFGAVGTCGQRCTTTRRLLLHKPIAAAFTQRLLAAYARLAIGDPRDDKTLVGPLIDDDAVTAFSRALAQVTSEGGELLCGAVVADRLVKPALARSTRAMPMVQHEVFGPLLHIIEVDDVDDAVAVNNAVPQGLSASIFTRDLRVAERFLASADTGICNVNTGTSGAEIGGAFGGEKETGGGRESGSDAWKHYMRRQTATVNHGTALPLSQGVVFDL
ncbi:MAG: aldehyde dehydrogenase family protein [Deltaproteobacteria bacterium]|nr:aldehyde dehydrogenase family protein [Deltaproteobacteria bacterium]